MGAEKRCISIHRFFVYNEIEEKRNTNNMKKAGLVVAIEMDALKRKYGDPIETIHYRDETILKYITGDFELYVIRSGVGEIAASASTELLITKFDVDVIFNFGVVGGLTEEISNHRMCVVQSVVHYDFDTSAIDHCEVGHYYGLYPTKYIPVDEDLLKKALDIVPDLRSVICASADKFVDGLDAKSKIQKLYNADICEMEAAGIVLTANRNHVPCLLIKMVSDGVTGGAEEFSKELDRTSDVAMDILDRVMQKI